MSESQIIVVREAVGLFHDHAQLQQAINELELTGFERRKISVLGGEKSLESIYGHKHVPSHLLEDDPKTPREAKPKPEEVGIAQGALIGGGVYLGVVASLIAVGATAVPALVTAAASGAVGGGAVGGALAKMLGDDYADFFERQIEKGGILLWVITETTEEEDKAQRVMKDFGADHVHVHSISELRKAA